MIATAGRVPVAVLAKTATKVIGADFGSEGIFAKVVACLWPWLWWRPRLNGVDRCSSATRRSASACLPL